MGESKLPKAPPAPPQRPAAAIFALRASVAAWKSGTAGVVDDDTNAFMTDLSRLLDWIDHLEVKTGAQTALETAPDPAKLQ